MKTTQKSPILATIALSALMALSSHAAIIFSNPILSANPSASNPYTTGQTLAPNVTSTGIGRGAGAAASNAANRYNAESWDTPALDPTAYFSFVMTPTSPFKINFTDFVYIGQTGGNGPASFALRSSVDNFTANIGTPTAAGTTISLAGASFQGVSSTIQFRLYAWGANNPGGTFSVNEFTFNGTVVPEPSAVMLGCLGMLALLERRRAS